MAPIEFQAFIKFEGLETVEEEAAGKKGKGSSFDAHLSTLLPEIPLYLRELGEVKIIEKQRKRKKKVWN